MGRFACLICVAAALVACSSSPKKGEARPRSKYQYNIVSITGPNIVPPESWGAIQDTAKYFSKTFTKQVDVANNSLLAYKNATWENFIATMVPFEGRSDIFTIVVFAGHGNERNMLFGDNQVPYQRLVDYMEENIAGPKLLIVSSCFSGNAKEFLDDGTDLLLITDTGYPGYVQKPGYKDIYSSSFNGVTGMSNNYRGRISLSSIVYSFSLMKEKLWELDFNGDGNTNIAEVLPPYQRVTEELKKKFKETEYGVFAWGNTSLNLVEWQSQ